MENAAKDLMSAAQDLGCDCICIAHQNNETHAYINGEDKTLTAALAAVMMDNPQFINLICNASIITFTGQKNIQKDASTQEGHIYA